MIGGTTYGKVMKTGNGDIGYHIRIKEPQLQPTFDEGEIIGIGTDSEGKPVLFKLTLDNAHEAFLRGVKTNSQWIEAHVPAHGGIMPSFYDISLGLINRLLFVCLFVCLFACCQLPLYVLSAII